MDIGSSHIPNFFIIGAPRGATTALYEYLGQHPQIFMSDNKEPLYFATDLNDPDKIGNEKEYSNLFKNVKNQKVIGEASVWYLYSKAAAEQILKFNPEAKLLISLRHPTEMLISLHVQHIRYNYQKIKDFGKALESQINNFEEDPVSFRDSIKYLDVVKYSEQIKRYINNFDPNQIKVILYDDIVDDIAKTFREILKFLDVDLNFNPDFQIINRRRYTRFNLANNFTFNLRKARANTEPGSFLYKASDRIISILRYVNTSNVEEKDDPELVSFLNHYFIDEILSLEKVINRDLSSWIEKAHSSNIDFITREHIRVHYPYLDSILNISNK